MAKSFAIANAINKGDQRKASMKYLTTEWYKLCQQTYLHFGLRVHKDAIRRDEDLFKRLYKRKEKAFIQMERKVYDVDPRFMLENEGMVFVSADTFIKGDEINEEETLVYQMSPDERRHITELIEEYDSRPPFDEDKSRKEFCDRQGFLQSDNTDRLPEAVYSQIADPRVFALGYCTEDILNQLKKYSRQNKKRVDKISSECRKMLKKQDVPEALSKRFAFHDCKVINIEYGNDIAFYFDTRGGFTESNKIVFHDAKIIKQESSVEESIWLYQELYRNTSGYEAHMLFAGEIIHEFTISCKDITVDKDF
jgi:hypothetical protein